MLPPLEEDVIEELAERARLGGSGPESEDELEGSVSYESPGDPEYDLLDQPGDTEDNGAGEASDPGAEIDSATTAGSESQTASEMMTDGD